MQLNQKELEEAKRLRENGMSFTDIGRKLGYKRQEVWYGLTQKLGMDKEGRTGRRADWDTELGWEMYQQGCKFTEIAKAVDRPYDTVRMWIYYERKRRTKKLKQS